MNDVALTVLKAINGGTFVVAFALVGEMAVPKRFAGLFSAAPSIAVANLVVIVISQGHSDAQRESTGMLIGAIALTVASAAGIGLIARLKALRGSVALCGLWLVLAEAGYLAVLR